MTLVLPCSHPTLWRPEYGSYMIEGTPGQPYGGTMSEFNTVEDNMRKRRKEATSLLGENQALCTITSFPRLVPVSACRVGILHLIPALDSGTLMLCGQLNMRLQQSHTPASANGGDQEDPGEDCLGSLGRTQGSWDC